MKAVNLFLLSRNKDMNLCSEYENVVSERKKKIKEHEYHSLCSLVNALLKNKIQISQLNGFHFSYSIKQISKEFDLLKVKKGERVINIELKSEMTDEQRIKKQLIRNRYYLRHIADRIDSFTYILDINQFYTLQAGRLVVCKIEDLIDAMWDFTEYDDDLNKLFDAKNYLISPLNMPDHFINKHYFLTGAQEQIKQEILTDVKQEEHRRFWGITGSAGTGKTLLLYDLARDLAEIDKVCMVHCGVLSEGHYTLKGKMNHLNIIDANSIKNTDLSHYSFILIDETQRIFVDRLELIIETVRQYDLTGIFSYDKFQTLSNLEENNEIVAKLNSIEGFREERLRTTIRTNEEMASFIRTLLNLNKRTNKIFRYDGVEIVCANSGQETNEIISYYRNERGYVFIDYTKSGYYSDTIDRHLGDKNTHNVIGQEYDNIIIVMDKNFYYTDQGHLMAHEHPNRNDLFHKLFFQGVSRVRERLCIVVYDNPELLKQILGIKYRTI